MRGLWAETRASDQSTGCRVLFRNKLPTALTDQWNSNRAAASHKSLTIYPEMVGSKGSWQLWQQAPTQAGWLLLTKAGSRMESEDWGKELNPDGKGVIFSNHPLFFSVET